MRIKRSQLARLVESYLKEDDQKKGKYAIYFAARSFSGIGSGYGHAWVMVKKPGEGITSFSGKSGIEFTAATAINRFLSYRDLNADELIFKADELYNQGKITKKELKDVIEKGDWKELKKMKNWERDTFAVGNSDGNYLVEVMPHKNDSQEEVKAAVERIEGAFENYNESVPYDPLPGQEYMDANISIKGLQINKFSNTNTRNSNSFAYTLLRHALESDEEVVKRTGDPGMKLPGFRMLVAGMKP